MRFFFCFLDLGSKSAYFIVSIQHHFIQVDLRNASVLPFEIYTPVFQNRDISCILIFLIIFV
jgi:hypothetical protein